MVNLANCYEKQQRF
jgi:tetratricopeptide (TPR) repeat protein